MAAFRGNWGQELTLGAGHRHTSLWSLLRRSRAGSRRKINEEIKTGRGGAAPCVDQDMRDPGGDVV